MSGRSKQARRNRQNRRRGGEFEREVVNALQDNGIAAERILGGGVADGKFSGDVSCPVLGDDRHIQCKRSASGFKRVYDAIEGHYALALRSDRQEPLIVLRLRDFAELCIEADRRRLL